MNFEVKFTENQKHTTVGFNEGQESIVADFSENQANFDTEFTENQTQTNIPFNENESRTEIDFDTFQTLQGVGISKIEKTATEGLVDTYVVTLTNGETSFFTVTNGIVGKDGKDGYTPIKDVDYFDGKDGKDGYTPQKGTDYFTDEDKAEISEQAKELIDFSPYQPKTDETLETESKEIVGAINELHNKVDLKGNYLGNTSWMVLSDWEATHSYGKFNINGTVSYYDYSTRATVSFNIKSIQIGYHPSGNGAYDNIGFTRVDGAMTNFLNNTRVFTLDIVDGDDISNRYLLEWLLNFGIKTKGEYTEDKTVSEAIDEAKETLAILQSEIAGTTWMMLDFDVTLGFEYKFPFYSNGEKFTSMKYSGENYIFYLDYYRADGTSLRVCEYDFLNATHSWPNEAYREITTHFSSHYVFENSGIAVKQGAGTIPNQLDTNAKTLVGAINELYSSQNVYIGYKDKETGILYEKYENGEFSVPITVNATGLNVCVDLFGEDISWSWGDFTIDLTDTVLAGVGETKVGKWFEALFDKGQDVFEAVVNVIKETDQWKTMSGFFDKVGDFFEPFEDFGHGIDAHINNFIKENTDDNLETTDKTVVGAINELNQKINPKVTDLTGKTYYVPSGWEVTKEYGKFDVIADVTSGSTTKTLEALNLGYATSYAPELYGQKLVAHANALVFGKPVGQGVLVDYITKYSSLSGFTVTFTGGTDVTNVDLINWLDTWGELQVPEYQTKTDENLETKSKEIVGAINELNEKINATGGGSNDSIVGTWVFNEELTFPTLANPDENNDYYVDFESNNIRFNRFVLGETYMSYYDDVYGRDHDEVYNDGYWLLEELKTITIIKEPTDEEFITWLRANAVKQSDTPKEEMPQIRFVSMPCNGWFGWVDWSQIDGDQTASYENLKFTIEIVSGTLQVGDAIQLCRMSQYSGSTSYAPDGTKKYHRPKRKLRRLFEYTITEEDLEKRFITFEVPWNDKKAIKLFTVWATSGINDKTIYFRIRRPKGEINSGSNGGGMTVDAEFSNVVSIRCLSYDFEWYPNDETARFYQIRIT